MQRIAVCGGGSLTHAVVAVLGAHDDVEVRVLTRQPARWSREVRAVYLDIAEVKGRVALASDNPRDVVTGADLVILCTPACAREDVLHAIAPFTDTNAWLGSFPGYGGFDWLARSILGQNANVFGLQRVPYVRKTISYGEAVWISGIRPRLVLGALPAKGAPALARRIEELMGIPTDAVSSYLPITLSASNPLFHPARIYTAFGGYPDIPVPVRAQFYEEWDDMASEWYLALDNELQSVCRKLPIDMSAAQPIRIHYGIDDAAGLTRRIRSLRSLRDRPLPLIATDAGFVADTQSYYFSEDIPFGLLVVKAVASILGVTTPRIDAVIVWAQQLMRKEYLVNGKLEGRDCARLPLPARFGISTPEELAARSH